MGTPYKQKLEHMMQQLDVWDRAYVKEGDMVERCVPLNNFSNIAELLSCLNELNIKPEDAEVSAQITTDCDGYESVSMLVYFKTPATEEESRSSVEYEFSAATERLEWEEAEMLRLASELGYKVEKL